jgi:hypothetical protein
VRPTVNRIGTLAGFDFHKFAGQFHALGRDETGDCLPLGFDTQWI